MSKKELHRAEIVGLVSQKRMTQLAAAERLGMSERQLRRLLRAFEARGTSALVCYLKSWPRHERAAAI